MEDQDNQVRGAIRVWRTRISQVCGWSALVLSIFCCGISASAFGLSAGRVYEMVSPAYKGGYGVDTIHAVAQDGGSVVFASPGSFGGVPSNKAEFSYLAHREASGWSTLPLEAPSVLSPDGTTLDFSSSLASSVFVGSLGSNTGVAQQSSEGVVLAHQLDTPDTPANWELAGGVVLKELDGFRLALGESGASDDLCHVLVDAQYSPLLLSAVGTHERYYEVVRGCGGAPSLRLVGLNNAGGAINPLCAAEPGAEEYDSKRDEFNAISADGKEIFFTTKVEPSTECSLNTAQVFVRLDGSRTLEVSKSVEECAEVPCPSASARKPSLFEGASEDGSKVFFRTSQSLVGGDQDEKDDLYMARIGCPAGESQECEAAKRQVTSLVQVSHDPVSGEAAEMQGVVRIAPDGSRVYFVAGGVLNPASNAESQVARSGADNLYVYDTVAGGPPVFVTSICSGPGISGSVADASCPSDLESGRGARNDIELWSGPNQEAQSTGDGRFFVFSSYGRLAKDDTDDAKDVYRYDANSGKLERVSLGEAGGDANGNGSEGVVDDATIVGAHVGGGADEAYLQREMGTRAVSEDGSRIVFETSEALSPTAINGLPNIYEWHEKSGQVEGDVSLISSGNSLAPDSQPVISPQGNDVFFMTSAGLTPPDTDGVPDVYDARLGGGFPPVPAEPQECSGDACQGPLTNPSPLLVPGSVAQAPGEDFAPPSKPAISKKKSTPKKKPKARKRKAKRKAKRAARAHSRSKKTSGGKVRS